MLLLTFFLSTNIKENDFRHFTWDFSWLVALSIRIQLLCFLLSIKCLGLRIFSASIVHFFLAFPLICFLNSNLCCFTEFYPVSSRFDECEFFSANQFNAQITDSSLSRIWNGISFTYFVFRNFHRLKVGLRQSFRFLSLFFLIQVPLLFYPNRGGGGGFGSNFKKKNFGTWRLRCSERGKWKRLLNLVDGLVSDEKIAGEQCSPRSWQILNQALVSLDSLPFDPFQTDSSFGNRSMDERKRNGLALANFFFGRKLAIVFKNFIKNHIWHLNYLTFVFIVRSARTGFE